MAHQSQGWFPTADHAAFNRSDGRNQSLDASSIPQILWPLQSSNSMVEVDPRNWITGQESQADDTTDASNGDWVDEGGIV